jgi:hypothetical protein
VTLQRHAILIGALNAIVIALPAAIVAQVVADEGSALRSLCSLLVLVGLVIGGYGAARLAPDAPLSHGAVAAIAVCIVIQAFGVLRRTSTGDDVDGAALVATAILALGCGVLGAFLSTWRRP